MPGILDTPGEWAMDDKVLAVLKKRPSTKIFKSGGKRWIFISFNCGFLCVDEINDHAELWSAPGAGASRTGWITKEAATKVVKGATDAR